MVTSPRHTKVFQSHAGSIEASGQRSKTRTGGRSFNPTLVRLRLRPREREALESLFVSIPRWFD